MLPLLTLCLLAGPARSGDSQQINDPMRPVMQITREGFTLQYFTQKPCPTRIQLRTGDLPIAAYRGRDGANFRLATEKSFRLVEGDAKPSTWHEIKITGLKPGTRYWYRIFDPGAEPTSTEELWGADEGWRREFAVSTLAPLGKKTIIHLPVKVLIMPNVINIESAYADPAHPAPQPAKITQEQIDKIKGEFAVSARYLWVNSGMRLWVDYQIWVDDRWQRWGPEPANADSFYKNWPVNRSYAGQDYLAPGGGDFTIFDTKDPQRATKDPVVEDKPYSGQIEMAWPRRWNAQKGEWEFYNSGGGTLGVDQFPLGIPGRSQYLGGGDSAWLATHEFHHDLESHGEWSLSNREDERVVFNHPAPRHRTVDADGNVDEMDWTTSGRHGEHWDVMAYWDRTLSDAQWLRFYFGYTETVADRDMDGVPDDDQRLPLDEKRFGSNPSKPMTDGEIGDLDKVMESIWAPGPLQSSWIKPPYQGISPNPTKSDTDGDGLIDSMDPYPLYPYKPFVVPMHATVDGDPSEWASIDPSGSFVKDGISFIFKQSHDEAGYFGLFLVKGPWQRVAATFDGEGLGVYSGVGVQGFEITKNGDVRQTFGGAPGLRTKLAQLSDGSTAIEFSLPNRGEGKWYWSGGGREIGSSINVFDPVGRAYCVYEPYHFFYARMLESYGKTPLPSNPPSEVEPGPGVQVFKPGDPNLLVGQGWKLEDGLLKYGGMDESPVHIEGLALRDFDLWVEIEGKSDGVLGAFLKGNPEMNAGSDYIGFIGGYANTVSKMRLFGQEVGDERLVMTPGVHRIQLSRRDGSVWLIFDGKPLIWSSDPNPQAIVERVAVIGGYGGDQVVHEIRLRAG